jgi:hypothetical protein
MKAMFVPAMVVVAATALVAGSYSALAGNGPVSDAVEAVLGSEHDEDSDSVNDVDLQGDGESDGEALGAMENAEAIAEGFDVDAEEVMDLHEDGIGFGALLKLYQLAEATGVSVEELLASIEADGEGYAFGKRFKELSEEELANLDGIPTNLGQLKKELREAGDGDGDSSTLESTNGNSAKSKSNGPPDHAKAHGRP